MAVSKIDEIFIYTYPLGNPVETQELYAFLDHTDILYAKLEYNDPAQHAETFAALNTWWQVDLDTGEIQPPLSSFPFAVYTEIHYDKTVSYLPRKYILGKEQITTLLPELYKLGR